jgi:flagellar hook protein FlgE
MDVIGNNIANVNTAGYKTSRVIFQDIFSQNVSAGMANQGQIGGTNPMQIGLGIRLSTVDVIHSRAAFQRTDRELDMMINGDGYFIVAQINPENGLFEPFYTRAGNFDIDNEGYLVTSGGLYVLGRNYEMVMSIVDEGADAVTARAGSLRIAAGGNAPAGTWVSAGYFADGDVVPVGLLRSAVPEGPGGVPAAIPAIPAAPAPAVPGDPIPTTVTLTAAEAAALNAFITEVDADGELVNGTLVDGVMMMRIVRSFPSVPRELVRVEEIRAQPQRDPVFGLEAGGPAPGADAAGLTRVRVTAMAREIPVFDQLSAAQQAILRDIIEMDDEFLQRQALDAFFMDFDEVETSLPGFSVADNGDISVILGNRKVVIGRLALGMFSNPSGLEKAGNSLYRESASSGPVVVTEPFEDGAGKIDGGGLEMSNVDVANEFTDMIVTQRGFQANSRIITVSDTMLEELVNLKR